MSASANADNETPVPCANDCGFWGRPSTGNFCSACYKQKVASNTLEKTEANDLKTKVEPSSVKIETKDAEESEVKADVKPDNKPVERVQKNRMRCFSCRKKVGLTGTECRCGFVYCGEHRYPEEHNCEFDFKTLAKEKVATKFAGAVVDKIQGEKL